MRIIHFFAVTIFLRLKGIPALNPVTVYIFSFFCLWINVYGICKNAGGSKELNMQTEPDRYVLKRNQK